MPPAQPPSSGTIAGISGSSSASRASSGRRRSPSLHRTTTARTGRRFNFPLRRARRSLCFATYQLGRSREEWHHLHSHRFHRPRRRWQRLRLRRLGYARQRPHLVRHRRPHSRPPYHHRDRAQWRHSRFRRKKLRHRWPLAASSDGGRTWVKSKTPFDPLDSGERPSVIRLASGRLFFVADNNPNNEKHTHKDGAFIALSDDDGKTWKLKRLPSGILTVGFVTATQGPDGIIHIVTSKNAVNYEIELKEAWIISDSESASPEPQMTGPVTKHAEKWPNGKSKAEWGTARASDGRVVLEGPQSFYFDNGAPQWTANFHLGKKVGDESFYRMNGTKEWTKSYSPDGTWTWRIFDESGTQTSESHWRGKTLVARVPGG